MLFETLPPELVVPILRTIETWWSKEIAPLTRVSTEYYRIFTPILYRTIVIYKARDLQMFHEFAEPGASEDLLGRLASYFSNQRRIRRERRLSLLAMIQNLSIFDASASTASVQGVKIMRAILAACPNIVSLQVSPTICPHNLLAGLRPIPRLYVCDSILDDPFLLGVGDCARSLTHLHVMDLRYFSLWARTLQPFQDDIVRAFPRLTVFSTTSELEAHEYSARLAAAVHTVLAIPSIERVNIEITCEEGIDHTESPVYRALHDLQDTRVYAAGAVPRMALLSSIIELARWRRGAIGVDDFWHVGNQVYQPES